MQNDTPAPLRVCQRRLIQRLRGSMDRSVTTSRNIAINVLTTLALALPAGEALAGSIFVSPDTIVDFHASLGANAPGAQHIIQDSLIFARDGNTAPILFIQSNLDNLALGDHTDSALGLQASGYSPGATPGDHYVTVDAATFLTTDLSLYSAIFIPSDRWTPGPRRPSGARRTVGRHHCLPQRRWRSRRFRRGRLSRTGNRRTTSLPTLDSCHSW